METSRAVELLDCRLGSHAGHAWLLQETVGLVTTGNGGSPVRGEGVRGCLLDLCVSLCCSASSPVLHISIHTTLTFLTVWSVPARVS